jgi:hypothetical protein
MALKLNGTNQWPTAKDLIRFAEGRSLGSRQELVRIFERVLDALSDVRAVIEDYCQDHPEFKEIGQRMSEEWNAGRRSLELKTIQSLSPLREL